jgi:putative Ca2+/H+ antiporter (TMEM165/GDT1 family)
MKNPFTNPFQKADPLQRDIPYTEKNFEIGFLSSIIHTFILIFFAELGDKTFIMLFILQLRTNKVTIFYSALFAEILMNTLASVCGFLIEYLLYINLIEYLGILFFVIYGIFLILSGFKKSEDTFEEEFEMIENMHKQRINRTPSMILGLEEDEENNNTQNDNDKYNLDSVNKYNDKSYSPFIKKELTIIPESDISREDSIFNEENLLSKKKDNKEPEDEDFLLNKKASTGFKLNFKKSVRGSNVSAEGNQNKNKKTNNEKKDYDNEINNTEGSNNIVLQDDNNENENENQEEGEGQARLRGRKDLYKSRSRYALDYLDKNIDVDRPNIDTSIFGTIFFSICLSEFGDRTQLISLTTSSIFHFGGSIVGSCLALFCSCLIGVYFSRKVMKFFKQKVIDFILGAIFLGCGIQIFISKRQSQTGQTGQTSPVV